jgi:hypothetical protein
MAVYDTPKPSNIDTKNLPKKQKNTVSLAEQRRLSAAENLALQELAKMEKEMGLSGANEDEYKKMIESRAKGVQFIDKVLAGQKTPAKFEIYLPEYVQNKIKNIIGFKPTHKISANGIRHANIGHGIKGKKLANNTMPLTKADFELIPDILQHPDYITNGTEHINGRKSIKYVKHLIDGKIIYIESEEYNDTTEFITKTMWKEKQKP